ncbi:MAG: hypothetical protein ACLQDY_00870 [Streptosporangiaceae bacterium]
MSNGVAVLIVLALIVMFVISFWRVLLMLLLALIVAAFGLGVLQISHLLHR